MASEAVVNAVAARLAANWNKVPLVGVNLNESAPADGSPFIVVQYPIANEEQISVGSPGANIWREEGVFRLVIHAERGGGVAQGLQWADELRTLFRGKHFDGVETFAPSPPAIDDSNDIGNYFQLSVAVPYQFDRIG